MAIIRPFRAFRPVSDVAPLVAAVPYDVVDTEEARQLAQDNPLSFLHVSRAEIDLPATVDLHDDAVYLAASDRYRRLKRSAPFIQDEEPSLYLYHLSVHGHDQTGVAAGFSLREYDADLIRKHERTRRDKEDDRTRHIIELRAQTGPVFLTHRPSVRIEEVVSRVQSAEPPFVDFKAADGVRHALWRLGPEDGQKLAEAFESVDALYIADGHHRAASAARARNTLRGSEEAEYFLAVAFPSNQVRILPYNRVVRDLDGMDSAHFLAKVRQGFSVTSDSTPQPAKRGNVSMYLGGHWHTIALGGVATGGSVIDSLDGNMLQEKVLKPLLGITDIRTDSRIDFVGGIKGTKALEQLVDSGRMAVAFSMYPVSIDDVMRVSDSGGVMPPKSTWFEPKLRDGLLIHEI